MNCERCKNKVCLKTGTPCERVEKLLIKEGIRSRKWIRPRICDKKGTRMLEIPSDPEVLDRYLKQTRN